MQPPAHKSILLSNQFESSRRTMAGGEAAPTGRSGDRMDVVSSISKESSEGWSSLGGSRGKMMVSPASPTAGSALTKIYSPPSQTIPNTSEGIVVQALSVVADQHATHLGSTETSTKKVAKKRRKQNGRVDVEHSKSSKEFLRKAQQSLRSSQGESEEDDPSSLGKAEQARQPAAETTRKGILAVVQANFSNPADEESSVSSKTAASTIPSDNSNCVTGGIRDSSVSGNAREDNPYGYENPDHVVAPIHVRRMGRASRRCSVTEHTIRAVHEAAAAAALERQQRLVLTRSRLEENSRAAVAIASASQRLHDTRITPTARSVGLQPPSRQRSNRQLPDLCNRELAPLEMILPTNSKVGSAGVSTSKQHLRDNKDPTVMAPPVRRTSLRGRTNSYEYDVPKMANHAGDESSSNPYGYEDMELPVRDHYSNSKSQMNTYGYEDPDGPSYTARMSSKTYSSGNADNKHSTDIYGYGEEPVRPIRPRRRRPQRRGSVTKFSLEAAKMVLAGEHKVSQSFAGPASDQKGVVPMSFEMTSEIGRLSPGLQAPEMPVRKQSPWQKQSSANSSHQFALLRNSRSLDPPSVHAPPVRAESFRTTNSNDMLSSSDEEDNKAGDSSSDDESLDDSVTSITIPLKSGDRVVDRPMPVRHDSCRSFASRGSTHSVQTLDSEADSLAPDMQSLCSISQREQRTVGLSTPRPPTPLTSGLSRTPSSWAQHRKHSMVSGLDLGDASNSSHGATLSLDRLAERQHGGSLPLVAFASGGEASPLNSPSLKPRSYLSMTPSGHGKSSMNGTSFTLTPSTVAMTPAANNSSHSRQERLFTS